MLIHPFPMLILNFLAIVFIFFLLVLPLLLLLLLLRFPLLLRRRRRLLLYTTTTTTTSTPTPSPAPPAPPLAAILFNKCEVVSLRMIGVRWPSVSASPAARSSWNIALRSLVRATWPGRVWKNQANNILCYSGRRHSMTYIMAIVTLCGCILNCL